MYTIIVLIKYILIKYIVHTFKTLELVFYKLIGDSWYDFFRIDISIPVRFRRIIKLSLSDLNITDLDNRV